MKTLLITLLLTVTTFAGLPTKLEELQQRRDKAIENINLIYKQELQKLLVDPAVKADPVELAKIQSELFGKSDIIDTDKWKFHGQELTTEQGTVFIFKKDFTGKKTTNGVESPVTWRYIDSLTIEVSGRDTPQSPIKVWFFKFFAESKTIKYGLALNQIEWLIQTK